MNQAFKADWATLTTAPDEAGVKASGLCAGAMVVAIATLGGLFAGGGGDAVTRFWIGESGGGLMGVDVWPGDIDGVLMGGDSGDEARGGCVGGEGSLHIVAFPGQKHPAARGE